LPAVFSAIAETRRALASIRERLATFAKLPCAAGNAMREKTAGNDA